MTVNGQQIFSLHARSVATYLFFDLYFFKNFDIKQ